MFTVILFLWIGVKLSAPEWYFWLIGIAVLVKITQMMWEYGKKMREIGKDEAKQFKR